MNDRISYLWNIRQICKDLQRHVLKVLFLKIKKLIFLIFFLVIDNIKFLLV